MYTSGVPLLDEAVGYFPPGAVELFGGDACGKTSLALSIMRESDGMTALIYTDGYPDKGYFRRAGPKDFVAATPTSGEQAFEIAFSSLRSGAKVVVIDNVTNLLPYSQACSDLGADTMQQRRMVYHGVNILAKEAKKRKALVVLVSQARVPINKPRSRHVSTFEGIMTKLCSSRVYCTRTKVVNEYGRLSYAIVSFLVAKSTEIVPGNKARGFIFREVGFSRNFELLMALKEHNIIQRHGTYFKFPGVCTLVGPGTSAATNYVKLHYDDIVHMYYEKIFGSEGG